MDIANYLDAQRREKEEIERDHPSRNSVNGLMMIPPIHSPASLLGDAGDNHKVLALGVKKEGKRGKDGG